MNWVLVGLGIIFNVLLLIYVILWFKRLGNLKTAKLWLNLSKVKFVVLMSAFFLGSLVSIILLRPNLGIEQTLEGNLEANIAYVFVVDTSASMAAKDVNGQSRMAFVKNFVHKVLDNYPAYSSLILFTEMPRLTLPFTFDDSTVLNFIDALQPEYPTYAMGTDIVQTMEFVIHYIEVASEKLHKQLEPVIFLLTDGECVKAKCDTIKLDSGKYEKFIIVGVGTKSGANIEFQIGKGANTEKYLLRDPNKFQPVVTKLNEEYLQNLASNNRNASYYNWQYAEKAVVEVQKLYKLKSKKAVKNKLVVKREIYPILVLFFAIGFIIFLFDIFIYEFYYKIKI